MIHVFSKCLLYADKIGEVDCSHNSFKGASLVMKEADDIKFEGCIFNHSLHSNIEGSNTTLFDNCTFNSLYKFNFTINGDGHENFYISNCVFEEITDGFLSFDSEIRDRLVIESSSFLRISTPKFLSLLEGPKIFVEYFITNCKFENITGRVFKMHSHEINNTTDRIIVISNSVFSSPTLTYYSMLDIRLLFSELHIVNCSFKEITTGFTDMLYIETPSKFRTVMKVFIKECAFSEVTPGTNRQLTLVNFPVSEQVLDLQIIYRVQFFKKSEA